MSEQKLQVQRLKGVKNYNTWKIYTRATLIREGLWNTIEGEEFDLDRNSRALSTI